MSINQMEVLSLTIEGFEKELAAGESITVEFKSWTKT